MKNEIQTYRDPRMKQTPKQTTTNFEHETLESLKYPVDEKDI